MNKILLLLSTVISLGMTAEAQIQVPHKGEFLNYWNDFKNAIKGNDADFLFNTIQVPFDGEGSYYNPEAEMDEIKENYMLIYPPYLREMEFVRFDAVLVEGSRSYIWLGYAPDEDAYFYCFKNMPSDEGSSTVTYSEKWWFKRLGPDQFRFYRTTQEYD